MNMAYRNGNYAAFYVRDEFDETNLSAHAKKDFCYYNMLRAWKGSDKNFPFNDSHKKNYDVRDGSDWEKTLKPRLRQRLKNSKNIILFLSSNTKSSRALREEIDYGINNQGLPIIIIYPEYTEKSEIRDYDKDRFQLKIMQLWEKIPILRDSMEHVPTIHLPMKKELIKQALGNEKFMFSTKAKASKYYFKI